MSALQPFNPSYGSTQEIAATSSSSSVVIDPNNKCKQVRILNMGGNMAYVRAFDSKAGAVSATTKDFPIPGVGAAWATTFTKFQDHDSIAIISPDGTDLIVTIGEGF